MGGVSVGGAEDGADPGGIEAVGEIMLLEQVGGGDGNGTQLVEAQDGEPELVVALEHQHHPVALFDAQALEVVGGPVGALAHVREGEATLHLVAVQVQHGQLLRLALGDAVHDVKGKVELLLILKGHGLEHAVFILHRVDELVVDPPVARLLPLLLPDNADGGGVIPSVGGGVQHQGVKDAVLSAYGDHAVGGAGIIVDAVPGAQNLAVLAHLDLQVAADHDVAFLALVGGEGDVPALRVGVVLTVDVQRLRDFVLKGGGQAVIGHAVGLFDLLTLALAGDGVASQLGAGTLDDVGDIHVEGQGTAVDKGEGQVMKACLTGVVFLQGYVGEYRHLLGGEAHDLPQLTDTACHLMELEIQPGSHLLFHYMILP